MHPTTEIVTERFQTYETPIAAPITESLKTSYPSKVPLSGLNNIAKNPLASILDRGECIEDTLYRAIKGHRVETFFGQYEDWEVRKALNDEGYEIYFMANRIKPDSRGKDADVVGIRCVSIDFDGKTQEEEKAFLTKLSAFPISPTQLVQTSLYCYQAHFAINDLLLQDYSSTQKALARFFKGDPSVCNPGRLFRMPGTINRKKNNFCVQLLEGNGQSYTHA